MPRPHPQISSAESRGEWPLGTGTLAASEKSQASTEVRTEAKRQPRCPARLQCRVDPPSGPPSTAGPPASALAGFIRENPGAVPEPHGSPFLSEESGLSGCTPQADAA